MRLLLALLSIILMAFPRHGTAQYFGQYRVQYRHLDFSIIETEHCDVYS